jgi:histone-lysine N-methyltransferase SETD8
MESKFEIRETPTKGKGVFALETIFPTQVLFEYKGDVVVKNDEVMKKINALSDEKRNFVFEWHYEGVEYITDASDEKYKDTLGRNVNHSRKDPNIYPVILFKGEPHLVFRAKRKINAGEELLYDYGDYDCDCDWMYNT